MRGGLFPAALGLPSPRGRAARLPMLDMGGHERPGERRRQDQDDRNRQLQVHTDLPRFFPTVAGGAARLNCANPMRGGPDRGKLRIPGQGGLPTGGAVDAMDVRRVAAARNKPATMSQAQTQ